MDALNRTSEHLLHLMSCALRGAEADAGILDSVNLTGLLALARNHSVAAMVCMALEKTAVFEQADPEVKKQWLDAKNKAIRKSMLLDAERRILMDEMENAGIWHMPLKGSVLKAWYPQYGMREMSDTDILFDGSRRKQVRDIFLRHGYSAEYYGRSNHDVYIKPPVYNFEMHVSLFNDSNDEKAAEKYAGIRQRLIPDESGKHCYHFTREDFYIFAIMHAYKHYNRSGTGIRTLADMDVMIRQIGSLLDWAYVEKELEELGALEYERSSRALAAKIFGEAPVSRLALTDREREMLLYCMQSSTYGNIENGVTTRLQAIQADEAPITGLTRVSYCLSRLFPSRQWCKDKYPLVYRYPCLMPLFWVWRWMVKIPARRDRILKELSALKASRQ
ncbi:MAG: nucleotidyltransferase family protein [bacterium]|nr:nucleotidyltransferase family protein [bacterium]